MKKSEQNINTAASNSSQQSEENPFSIFPEDCGREDAKVEAIMFCKFTNNHIGFRVIWDNLYHDTLWLDKSCDDTDLYEYRVAG